MRVGSRNRTFSLIASCTSNVSVETLKTTSPVLASVSKKPTSCFSTASKYFFLSALACLSPLYIQQLISVVKATVSRKMPWLALYNSSFEDVMVTKTSLNIRANATAYSNFKMLLHEFKIQNPLYPKVCAKKS